METNVIRIDEEAHECLRSIKKQLKPTPSKLGEIASTIIKSYDQSVIDGMSKADKKRTARKEAK